MSTELLQLLLWLVFLAIGVFVCYSGLLHDVHVLLTRPPISATLEILYAFGKGPYKNVGKIFRQLQSVVPNGKFIGIYYDDPAKVEESKLRWIAGVIVKIDGTSELSDESLQKLKQSGYLLHTLPKLDKAVVTDFCNTTFLSIFIASFKVYSRIKQFLKKNPVDARPCVELYFDQTIHYVLPVTNQPYFYVPELTKMQ